MALRAERGYPGFDELSRCAGRQHDSNTVYTHRTDFPESDRLLVEVRFAGGHRERIELFREITTRFPEYWPAWFELGDELAHHGTFVGRQQRQLLDRSTAPGGAALGRSLAALEEAMTGLTVPAARSLAALEWENADRAWHFDHGAIHPFFSAVNRIAAAGWLLAAADTTEVMSLLLLHNASLPQLLHPLPAANAILASLAMAELASLEESRGSVERGRRYRA